MLCRVLSCRHHYTMTLSSYVQISGGIRKLGELGCIGPTGMIYFKHVDIMDAKLGSNPSYIWRYILWSRELIRKGIMWRVGNGHHTKAFEDSWILRLAKGRSTLS